MRAKWYNWEQVIQWLLKDIIINNLKCQFGLHHCDGLVETIEMDISFVYFWVWMKEICTRQDHHLDMWARWDPHQTTWRRVATLDAMCPWHITNPRKHTFDQSGDSTRIQGPTSPRKQAKNTAYTPIHTWGPTWQSPGQKAVETDPPGGRPNPNSAETFEGPLVASWRVAALHWFLKASRGVLESFGTPSKPPPCL